MGLQQVPFSIVAISFTLIENDCKELLNINGMSHWRFTVVLLILVTITFVGALVTITEQCVHNMKIFIIKLKLIINYFKSK